MKKNISVPVITFWLIFHVAGATNIQGAEICGIENCHGLEITCGPNVPEMCLTIYKLGDFCREYVRCQLLDGQCRVIKDEKFDTCKQCVEDCLKTTGPADSMKIFDCETLCRN